MLSSYAVQYLGYLHCRIFPAVRPKHLQMASESIKSFHFISFSFHLFADNIAIYKADTVILGCTAVLSI